EAKLYRDAQIVFDGTLHDYHDGTRLIDQALEAGKRVVIVALGRDGREAFFGGVIPRGRTQGRPVPLDEHLRSHSGIRSALSRYARSYEDIRRVQFGSSDN